MKEELSSEQVGMTYRYQIFIVRSGHNWHVSTREVIAKGRAIFAAIEKLP